MTITEKVMDSITLIPASVHIFMYLEGLPAPVVTTLIFSSLTNFPAFPLSY